MGCRRWWEPVIVCVCVSVIGRDEARRERRAWWRGGGGGGYVGGGDVDAPKPCAGWVTCPGEKRVPGLI